MRGGTLVHTIYKAYPVKRCSSLEITAGSPIQCFDCQLTIFAVPSLLTPTKLAKRHYEEGRVQQEGPPSVTLRRSMPLNGLLKRIAKLGSSEPEPEQLQPENSTAAARDSTASTGSKSPGSPVLVYDEPEELPGYANGAPSNSRQLLAVDTASLGRNRTGSNSSNRTLRKGLSPSAAPGLIFTPATPLSESPQTATASDSAKFRLFGSSKKDNRNNNNMRRSPSPSASAATQEANVSPTPSLHGDAEEEIGPPRTFSASPDSYTAVDTFTGTVPTGDLPGIPRSGSPLPMSDNEEEEEEEEEHDLRDAAEAKLEQEELEEAKNEVPSPNSAAATGGRSNKPDPISQFPSRHILQRLPSQAIADTPSTDSGGSDVRSPMSFGFPSMSRNPSVRSGAATSKNPSRMASMDRVQPLAARSPGPRSPGRNSPAARFSSEYGFPTAGLTADPKAIQEEDGISALPFPPTTSNSASGSGSTYASHITGSPPSSTSYLDASPHRFTSPRRIPSSRQTSTSSQNSSSHSISEYSTPAGFLKHRRNSSQNAREVKETPNAISRDLPNGKRKLNQYILTDDIGRGSFGIVQKAKDVNTGTEYAVKEFSKMRLRKRAQSEMMRRQRGAAGGRRGAVPMRRQPHPRTGQGGNGNDADDEGKQAENDLDLIREGSMSSLTILSEAVWLMLAWPFPSHRIRSCCDEEARSPECSQAV